MNAFGVLCLVLLCVKWAESAGITQQMIRDGSELTCDENSFSVTLTADLVHSGVDDDELFELFAGESDECYYIGNLTHMSNTSESMEISRNDDGDYVYQFTYPECGSERNFAGDYLSYDTVIGRKPYSLPSSNEMITRQASFFLDVTCIYYLNGTVVTTSYQALGYDVVDDLNGEGILTLSLDAYVTSNYNPGERVTETKLLYSSGKEIYFEISQAEAEPLHIVNENCTLTSTNDYSDPVRQDVLVDRCVVAPELMKETPTDDNTIIRFTLTTVGFLEEQDETYLWCNVLVCDQGDAESRCSQTPVCVSDQREKRQTDLTNMDFNYRYKSREQVQSIRIIVTPADGSQNTVGDQLPEDSLTPVGGGAVGGAVVGTAAATAGGCVPE